MDALMNKVDYYVSLVSAAVTDKIDVRKECM
jgi:hypothetical protein